METLIQEIIKADHEAQKHVQSVEQERLTIKAQVEAQREEVYKQYKEEVKQKLADHKQMLDEQEKQFNTTKTKEYEATLMQLQESFTKKKDVWIQEIVERCLDR